MDPWNRRVVTTILKKDGPDRNLGLFVKSAAIPDRRVFLATGSSGCGRRKASLRGGRFQLIEESAVSLPGRIRETVKGNRFDIDLVFRVKAETPRVVACYRRMVKIASLFLSARLKEALV